MLWNLIQTVCSITIKTSNPNRIGRKNPYRIEYINCIMKMMLQNALQSGESFFRHSTKGKGNIKADRRKGITIFSEKRPRPRKEATKNIIIIVVVVIII